MKDVPERCARAIDGVQCEAAPDFYAVYLFRILGAPEADPVPAVPGLAVCADHRTDARAELLRDANRLKTARVMNRVLALRNLALVTTKGADVMFVEPDHPHAIGFRSQGE